MPPIENCADLQLQLIVTESMYCYGQGAMPPIGHVVPGPNPDDIIAFLDANPTCGTYELGPNYGQNYPPPPEGMVIVASGIDYCGSENTRTIGRYWTFDYPGGNGAIDTRYSDLYVTLIPPTENDCICDCDCGCAES